MHPRESPPAGEEPHGATAVGGRPAAHDWREHRRILIGGFIGALGVTVVSAVFITAFIGGLHAPGPRGVPVGLVGPPARASMVGAALGRHAPGAFTITNYPSVAAARSAIGGRSIDAVLVPGPTVQHLLVASAVSEAETTAIIKAFSAGAAHAHVPLVVQNIRPLHSSDPQGLSMLFFVIALVAPSLAFGTQLISRIGTRLSEFWHVGMIAVYAVIVAAVATAIADAGIGALTGAPWAIFGVGVLLAFAAAAMGAAAQRWAGQLGFLVVLLLFVPVGISSSGSTLGPRMITPWYADVGRALLPGAGQSTVRNVTYFNGNAVTDPLLVLSAWALAAIIALALAALLHPAIPGQRSENPDTAGGTRPATARALLTGTAKPSPAAPAERPNLGSAPTWRALGVLVVVAQFDGLVLAAQRRHVEEHVARAEQVDDFTVARPCVQDGVAVPKEDADGALLARPGAPGLAHVL
jgi:hypothetical protein